MTHIRRKSALERIQRALASSLDLDYEVVVEERQDIRGNWSGWLVGHCQAGHEFEMATDKWLKNQRCNLCRRDRVIARWMEVAAAAGYKVSPVTRLSDGGHQQVWFVGACALGHPVDDMPSRMFRGDGCLTCYLSKAEVAWLATAKQEGYQLSCVRVSEGQRNKAYLVGTCPEGHPFRVRASHFVSKRQRCRECNVRARAEEYAIEARAEGYRVTINFGPKGAMLVGTCDRGHSLAMQTYTFKGGGRCGECRLEDVRNEHLASAKSEGYDVHLELRSNGTQGVTWLTGQCPEGHDVEVPMTRFAAGWRCHGRARSGFDPDKPAHLYVVEGRGLVKYGISNSVASRLATHEKSGFTEWRILIYSDDGALVQDVERMLKRWMPANAQNCHGQGMRFDGATEAFALKDFDWMWFDQLLYEALEQVDAPSRCQWYAADTGVFPATRSLGMGLVG